MLWRTDFSEHFTLESGILFTRRNFKINGNSSITGTNTADSTSFGYINYNLPLKGLVYIQLSEKMHISSSAGLSIDFYASDVSTMGKEGLIAHYSERARWINASIISGLGFEWRDDDKGVFYVGAGVNVQYYTYGALRIYGHAGFSTPQKIENYYKVSSGGTLGWAIGTEFRFRYRTSVN